LQLVIRDVSFDLEVDADALIAGADAVVEIEETASAIASGGNTPLDSMPSWLRVVMQTSPSTHFVSFAEAILYRGAGLDVVWPQFLVVAVVGGLFLGLSLVRFRKVASAAIA